MTEAAAAVQPAPVRELWNRIVPYEPRYLDAVMRIVRILHAESTWHRKISLDEEKLAGQFIAASKIPSYYFRLCVRNDEVLGGFLGHVTTVFFSREKTAKDISWYVERSRRGGGAAVALVRDFEAWAREQGATQFILGQATGTDIEVTKKLYEHLGYRVVGFNVAKDV